jgi:hypothetical protein
VRPSKSVEGIERVCQRLINGITLMFVKRLTIVAAARRRDAILTDRECRFCRKPVDTTRTGWYLSDDLTRDQMEHGDAILVGWNQ